MLEYLSIKMGIMNGHQDRGGTLERRDSEKGGMNKIAGRGGHQNSSMWKS